MRGIFALVLAAGVAAGAALLMWEDGPGEEFPPPIEVDPGRLISPNPGPPPDSPAGGANAKPRKGESAPARAAAVAAQVRRHLDAGRADLAAKIVLADEAGVLADAELRRDVFRTADRLVRDAQAAAGDKGTRMRLDARRLYAALYDCEASSDVETARAFVASRALHRVLVAGATAPESLVLRHKFRSGENLWTLARGSWKTAGISVASGFVLQVNGISDARRIRAGQTLRIPRERISLLVRKERFELTVLLGGSPVERFDLGLGANDSTPEGLFRIETKLKNPPWYYNGRKIEFGDPANVIGTRWMGFEDTEDAEGYGIHGTADESTVGRAVSLGCIRMRRPDVERLFEWVHHGCTVEIR